MHLFVLEAHVVQNSTFLDCLGNISTILWIRELQTAPTQNVLTVTWKTTFQWNESFLCLPTCRHQWALYWVDSHLSRPFQPDLKLLLRKQTTLHIIYCFCRAKEVYTLFLWGTKPIQELLRTLAMHILICVICFTLCLHLRKQCWIRHFHLL